MGKLGSFLLAARIFAPRLRGRYSIILYPISKNKVSQCSGDPDETIELSQLWF